MGWNAGDAAITQPRWSAGAYWAEDGNAQADDTDWITQASFDTLTAYSSSADLKLGVFVAGVDRRDVLRQASWAVGKLDTMPAGAVPSPGSCSITLKGSVSVNVADRVVLITPWDVLWWGEIESEGVSEAIAEPDDTTAISAVDPTGRLAGAMLPDGLELEGSNEVIASGLLHYAGLPGTVEILDPFVVGGDGSFGERSTGGASSVLDGYSVADALASMLRALANQSVWTAAGLRLDNARPYVRDEYGSPVWALEDFDAFHTISRSRDRTRIINRIEVAEDNGTTVSEYEWTSSIETYGPRTFELDASDWVTGMDADFMQGVIEDGADLTEPITIYSMQARLAHDRHDIVRVLPLDMIHDDATTPTEALRVQVVSHDVTPDAWTVKLDGHEIADETT